MSIHSSIFVRICPNGTLGKSLFIAFSSQHLLNLYHNLCDTLLFLEDILNELLWWQILEIYFAIRILNIKVAVISKNLLNWHLPGPFVFLAFLPVPPSDTVRELLVLQRLGLGVVFPAFCQR